MSEITQNQLFDIIGDKILKRMVDVFYSKIEGDDLLDHMFPEDKTYGKLFQYLFLKQAFGGPREYDKVRGHPMMRKRHMLFNIGFPERNRWEKLMLEAMTEVGIDAKHPARKYLEGYFDRMATKIMNKAPTSGAALNL